MDAFKRILVTNDDGINAAGIKTLVDIAKDLSDDVWVVAPLDEQSGASHSLTLTEPLRLRHIGEKYIGVSGTPTDCVMMAVHHLMKETPPTLVLSGINRGVNLGEDITYSGTVAGAMEGAIAGIPSIALSQAIDRERDIAHFDVSKHFCAEVIKEIVAAGWPKDVLINVNFPACDVSEVRGVEVTEQGRRHMGELFVKELTDPRGFPYFWFGLKRSYGEPDDKTDLKAVQNHWISVTPLHLELTHHETRNILRGKLDKPF